MKVYEKDAIRYFEIDGQSFDLPDLATDCIINVWSDGKTYQVFCKEPNKAEEIPAQRNFKKVFTLPLEAKEEVVNRDLVKNQKTYKAEQLKNDGEKLLKEQVKLNGITWRGGINSANSINGKIELMRQQGNDKFTLRDSSHKPHELTIGEAIEVEKAIRLAYEKALDAKEDALYRLSQISENDEEALTKIEEITIEV